MALTLLPFFARGEWQPLDNQQMNRYLSRMRKKPVRLTDHQKAVVCRLYQEGKSAYEIADLFGCSNPTIYHCLTAANVDRRDRSVCQRIYNADHSYFASIDTPEKAYWLGFISADGHIHDRYGALNVSLSHRDRDHLLCLAGALQSTHPLFDYTTEGHEVSRFYLASREMINDLRRHGIGPRKTFTILWPNLERDLQRHFLRGHFDGDGCWLISRNPGHIAFRTISNEGFLSGMRQFLESNCDIGSPRTIRPIPDKPIAHLTYHGNRQCLDIANLIYEEATVCLPRKMKIAFDHFAHLPNYRDRMLFAYT